MLTHTGEKPYCCKYCSYSSARLDNCKTHVLRKHKNKIRDMDEQDIAKKAIKVQKSLKQDTKQTESKNGKSEIYKCSLCWYKTSSRHCLQQHIKSHKISRSPKNPQSTKLNVKSMKTREHEGTKSSVRTMRMFVCSFCSHASKYKSNIRRHELVRHGKRSIKPPEKVFLRPPRKIVPNRGKKELFRCKLCSFASLYRRNLYKHEQLHKDKKKTFTCKICNYSTHRKANLIRHKTTLGHQKQAQLGGNISDAKENSSSKTAELKAPTEILSRQKETESEEKAFKCSLCAFKCAKENVLRVHMFMHSKHKVGQ